MFVCENNNIRGRIIVRQVKNERGERQRLSHFLARNRFFLCAKSRRKEFVSNFAPAIGYAACFATDPWCNWQHV
jgi:hypothetical protein